MVKISYFSEYEYDDCICLDKDGNLDSTQEGEYGYRVFYNVSASVETFKEYFKDIPEDFCGGQIEFTVDKDKNLVEDAEILLWITTGNENNGFENIDFVQYYEDISDIANDFKANH